MASEWIRRDCAFSFFFFFLFWLFVHWSARVRIYDDDEEKKNRKDKVSHFKRKVSFLMKDMHNWQEKKNYHYLIFFLSSRYRAPSFLWSVFSFWKMNEEFDNVGRYDVLVWLDLLALCDFFKAKKKDSKRGVLKAILQLYWIMGFRNEMNEYFVWLKVCC